MPDFNEPTTSETYTNVLQIINDNRESVVKWLDSTSDTNLPTGAKRWNDASKKFEEWSGAAWGDLAALYEIKVRNSDQLNAQTASYYLDIANMAAGILAGARFDNSSHGNRGNGTLHSVATGALAGFMAAADKSKLDGIESGAKDDLTATEILNLINTVDGAGSGLDADLLDGQHSAWHVARVNHTGTQLMATISDAGALALLDSINQTLLDTAAVGRGELKTTTSSSSVTLSFDSAGSRSLTGGTYSMWTASATNSGTVDEGIKWGSGNTSAGTIGLYNGSDESNTFYIDERYFQSSPPYTHGPLFIFLFLDNGTGNILNIDVAPDPPWAYHGPTIITPDRLSGGRNYKTIQLINDIPLNIALNDPATRNLFMAGSAKIDTAEVEIDLNYKDSDRDIHPHPWSYNIPSYFTDRTVVMLEPGSVLMVRLHAMLEASGAGVVRQLIEDGYLNVLKTDLDIPNKPAGIQVVKASWKNTL